MRHLNSIIILLLFITSAHAQNLWRTELIGKPTQTTISLTMFFTDSAEVRVEYGTQSGIYTSRTNWITFADSVETDITLTGLQANTKYYYRVNHRYPGSITTSLRPEYTFHTQKSPGSSFTFIVQADPHLDSQSDTALYRLCLKNQFEDSPDFMIDLGDFLMTDKLRNASKIVPRDTITYRCNLLRSYYEKIGHSVPIFIALGNHEGEAGWNLNGTANNMAVWGTNDRKKYFMNPTPDSFYTGDTITHNFVGKRANYYAWTWGDAMFVVLDPYWYTTTKPDSLNGWRWTLGRTQYNWLKTTLEKSNSTYKFVFSHQLVGGDPDGRGGVEFADRYEWGGNNLDGTYGFTNQRPGWDKPIKELLKENRVNIFFHGHDHFFGKQEKECLIYQETPQPSHPNFSTVNYAADYGYVSGQILPQSGHLRVRVDSLGVKVDYVRVYLPQNETSTRRNKDISASYFIGKKNCYDSLATGVPVIWNSNYSNEIVYPNPFEVETNIQFSLNNPDHLTLSIYDQKGNFIRYLLVDNPLPIGTYQISWDGKNYQGNQVSNGVYFYLLKGESGEGKSGKIVLQK